MKKQRVLVVDDEARLVRLVRVVLQTAGYDVVVATDGAQAMAMVALEQPDLILLDILLPGGTDGYEVCRRVREFSTLPVIMLTAKAGEDDKVKGFDLGADDYLTKPFSAKELLARIRAALRRSQSASGTGASLLVRGEVSLDLAQRRVTVGGKEVRLTATEYELLRQLAVNAGRVMLHGELLSLVWGAEYHDEVSYLRDYVRYLRRKIEPDPGQPRYILTRPGVGYLFATDGG